MKVKDNVVSNINEDKGKLKMKVKDNVVFNLHENKDTHKMKKRLDDAVLKQVQSLLHLLLQIISSYSSIKIKFLNDSSSSPKLK